MKMSQFILWLKCKTCATGGSVVLFNIKEVTFPLSFIWYLLILFKQNVFQKLFESIVVKLSTQ